MTLSVAARLLFSFACVLSVFAHEESLSLLISPLTFCHTVVSTSDQVYVSFLHTDLGHVTLYQIVWALPDRHLLECTIQEDQSLVGFYQSFCEASQANSTQHTFTDHQDSEVLQTLSAFQMLQKSCLMSSRSLSDVPEGRTKRDTSTGDGPVPEAIPYQNKAAEAVPKPILEGSPRTRAKRGWTMPGTLWCGAGNSAVNVTDIGIFQGTDLCCREHDHCSERLLALEFKYGVRNYRMHTVSHCDCDYRFKHCLHQLNDTISTFVGITFFNLLEVPCFTMEEREGCQAWHWWGGCKEYGPTPFAVLQKQGLYNYTHPFSDPLDERYKPGSATNGSTTSQAGSMARKIIPHRHSKNGRLHPDRNQRKKTRLRKHKRRPVQTTRPRASEVHLANHLPNIETSFARTDSNSLRLKDLNVTSSGAALWPEVIEDTVPKVLDKLLPEVMEGTEHKIVNSSLSEIVRGTVHKVVDDPLPEVMEDTVHKMVDSSLSQMVKDTLHRVIDSPLHEVMEERMHKVVGSHPPEVMEEIVHNVMVGTGHMLTDSFQSEGSQNPLPEKMKALHKTILETPLHKVMKVPLHERLDSSVTHLTEIAQTEGMKALPSESFSNNSEVQKHVRLELFYGEKPQSNMSDLNDSIAHLITDQSRMSTSSADQLSPDQTVTDYTSVAENREGQQNIDQTHTGYPHAGQLTASNMHAHQSSMSHPSTEPLTTGLFARTHSTAEQPGLSWASFDDQILIAQRTEKEDTSTLRTNQGQFQLNIPNTYPLTPSIIIHSSSHQPSKDVPMTGTVQGIQETVPITESTFTTFKSENRLGNYAFHGQLATYPQQRYVDSPTTSTPVDNPETEITRVHNFDLSTMEAGLYSHSKERSAAPVPSEVDLDYNQRNIFLNEKSKPVQDFTRITSHHIPVHHPSTTHRLAENDKSNNHYISKSCGCYRRLDQCEYTIAPYEEKFQLYNLDRKTLYHCNCTRRLARFLQRKKRPNEVQEVLSDFVSPSCFVLEPREVCDEKNRCRSVPAAVLAPSGHLKRTFRLLRKSSKDWTSLPGTNPEWVKNRSRGGASLKVKRQELKRPGASLKPVRLYEQCLQRVRKSWT
ncbi:group 3 secretory phospholipase A2 isoform X1 [Pleurodeles waltl]|uniref:group 3 secretory phospholipase A2 isoform X1 n=1 Tax=Pleurodeles waltl TaxID=8319 RepID=UPI0037099262